MTTLNNVTAYTLPYTIIIHRIQCSSNNVGNDKCHCINK